MDENEIDNTKDRLKETYDATHLSDVIDVIKENDPDFTESATVPERPLPSSMLNGGGQIPAPPKPSNSGVSRRHQAFVRIIEQPATKALRFRYECEGRSAGSIPGASSTPENKTYPEIQVEGYKGPAVVVVSCVMKDPPYPVHPHNLVGREGCKKGVCTLQIPEDTMRVQFSNLGIQCVKKRDIESSLRQREEIRVDPYRQHYHHRNQPTSIDLNAVRLCFQVFLQGDCTNKYNVALNPVVSDIIYDKKAMSDLSIIKLSDCVSYVDGGRKDIILLCEKVAKEDIEIHFYELENDKIVWEAKADFQPSQVHKQHAIWFRTPRYKKMDVTEPVKVFIQLYRPSDQVKSEPLPFELLPLNAGRTPPYWSFKHGLANKKANYDLFNSILANDAKLIAKRQLTNSGNNKVFETNNNDTNVPNYADVKKSKLDDDVVLISEEVNPVTVEEKSFDELINQVAELDAIYSDTQVKLLNETSPVNHRPPLGPPQDESFDDARTYSSLQLAFKNPVSLEANKKYEDIIIDPSSSKIGNAPALLPPKPSPKPVSPPKRDTDTSLPPLPPKRTKKLETYIGGSMTSIQLTGKQADILLTRSGSMRSASVSRSQSFNMQRPKSQGELSPPGKNLPPVPNSSSTLPNPKKRGFLSKLFGRKSSNKSLSKSNTPAISREASVTPSFHSTKSLQVDQNLSKSSGNISTHSSNSIRIRLKDDSPPPISEKATTLSVAPPASLSPHYPMAAAFDEDLDMQLDLTEAENYALYTAMAPQATQSEFDEFSCYYAPVEGGRLLTNAEVVARLTVCDKDIKRKRPKFDQAQAQIMNRITDQDRLIMQRVINTPLMEPIKTEPRDTTSPYGGSYGIMFQAASPNYTPSPAVSPQYLEMAPTPSPENLNYIHYRHQPINPGNFTLLPQIKTDQPTCSTWNIPTNPAQMPNIPTQNAAVVNSYLDLDNHQISSGELVNTINDMNMPVNQLMEINNLSLTDLIPTEMSSDSLTNIVNDAAKNLLQ